MSKKKNLEHAPSAEIIWGDAAAMRLIGENEVDLIVTSPPYFSSQTEKLLALPRRQQTDIDRVQKEVTAFALQLRPAFDEIRRVLRPGGSLVLQSKSIRFGEFLIPLADIHREIVQNTGLYLITKVLWQPMVRSARRLSSFERVPRIGSFRAIDTEEFSVFSTREGIDHGARLELPDTIDTRSLVSPLWSSPPNRRSGKHPHGSPPAIVSRFIELYSILGDLVVDPFAGHGTTLVEARKLGRRALGYDLEQSCVDQANSALAKAT